MTTRGPTSSTPRRAVLATARASRADRGRRRGRSVAGRRWTGRRCTPRTRSMRPRPDRGRVRRSAGCRWRVRVLRWWRSSRSPSSPPRSACRRMPGGGTSGTPWSSGTGCRGCGRGCVKGDLRPWLARRIADQTLLLSPEAAGVVDRHVAQGGAQDRSGPAGTAGGRGDRHVHAATWPRAAGSPKADGRYFTVEYQQQIVLRRHRRGHGELDLADAIDLEEAIAGRGRSAEGPRLHRDASTYAGSPARRRARPHPTRPRPDRPKVSETTLRARLETHPRPTSVRSCSTSPAIVARRRPQRRTRCIAAAVPRVGTPATGALGRPTRPQQAREARGSRHRRDGRGPSTTIASARWNHARLATPRSPDKPTSASESEPPRS